MSFVIIALLIVFIVVSIFCLIHIDKYLHFSFINLKENNDQVAKRVEEVAMLAVKSEQIVIDHQIALDKKVDELTRSLTEYNIFMDRQLERFHDLALSDLTTARRYELMRTKEVKSALERLMAITTMSRQPAVGSDVLALEAATSRISELEDFLGDNNSYSSKESDND